MIVAASVKARSRFTPLLNNEYFKITSLGQRSTLLVMLGIMLVAAALRLFHLGTTNFWYDEIATISYAMDLSRFDVHPPFYYGIIHILLNFTQSEFFIRLPSLIVDVFSVGLVYLVGKQLYSAQTTLIAVLLAAISPLLIWHAQDARMYSQGIMFVLLTLYFYVRILKQGSTYEWIGYTVSATLGLYTHLYTGLILVTLSLHVLVYRRDLLKRWVIANAVTFIAYIPWLLILGSLPEKQIGSARDFNPFQLFYTYYTFASGYTLGPTINELRTPEIRNLLRYAPLIVPLALVVGVLLVAGTRSQWKRNRERALLTVMLATVPVLLAFIIPLFRASMTFNVRFVIFAAPAFLWLLASGVEGLNRYVGIALLAVLIFFNGLSLYNHFFDIRYDREDVRSAAVYVAASALPDDHVLVITVRNVFSWYFEANNPVYSNSGAESLADLVGSTTSNTETVWLVEARSWQTDPQNEIGRYFEAHYPLRQHQSFHDVEVYEYCVAQCPS